MGELVQALIILAIVVVALAALIALATFASTFKDKREEKKLVEKSRRREEIMDRAHEVSKEANKLGFASSDTPEAETLRDTIANINSFGRDGQRKLDKLLMYNDRLDDDFAKFKESVKS